MNPPLDRPTAPDFVKMAEQKTIEQRVKEIIVNQLNVNEEQITPTASFLDDLGADSLDTVELIMAFEEEFKDEIKGEIPESDAEKLQCVSSDCRSAGVIASWCTASQTRCSTARWLFTTPFGWPVVPEV